MKTLSPEKYKARFPYIQTIKAILMPFINLKIIFNFNVLNNTPGKERFSKCQKFSGRHFFD